MDLLDKYHSLIHEPDIEIELDEITGIPREPTNTSERRVSSIADYVHPSRSISHYNIVPNRGMLIVEADGSLVTYNTNGIEVLRIDSTGLHVSDARGW